MTNNLSAILRLLQHGFFPKGLGHSQESHGGIEIVSRPEHFHHIVTLEVQHVTLWTQIIFEGAFVFFVQLYFTVLSNTVF